MSRRVARTDRVGETRSSVIGRTLSVAALAVLAIAGGACSADDDQEGETFTVAQGIAPDTLCVSAVFNGHTYWFCNNLRNWSTARSKCEAVGLNLARIDTAAENDFLRTQLNLGLWLRGWIGANDTATEGTWRWSFNNSRFWTGAAPPSGVPFTGMFNKWGLLSPDNFLNQDCAKILFDGVWADESCASLDRYICESGVDLCPNDPQKVEFGVCGCGVPDVDTDGDGKLDCEEQCPLDPTKLVPGHCGCSNAPKPAGTVCRDGLCDANTQCDGAGVCGNPSVCTAPDSLCHFFVARNTYYWFCNNDRQFSDARQRCQAAGTDLIAVDDAFEDSLFATHTLEHTFLGATDQAVEGDWVWLGRPMPFWTGGVSGSAVAGAFANWHVGQPAPGLPPGSDCVVRHPTLLGGKWETRSCGAFDAFACERESLPPLPNPLDLIPDPHLDPAAQGKNSAGPGAITPNPHYQPGHDACGAGLDLVTVQSDMEFTQTLQYPPPPLNTTPGDPNCRVLYRECTIDNLNPTAPQLSDLNLDPPDTQLCEAVADRAIEECGIDETTIDFSPQGLCTAHLQCVGRGFVCALLCTDAGCTTQERRCAFPKPGCFGLLEEANCATARECAEFDYSGDADPQPPHCVPPNCMTAHPPGNIDLDDTPPVDPTKKVLGDYPTIDLNNVCGAKPDVDNLTLPRLSEVREINVGNNKWGLFVTPSVTWEGTIKPVALFGESNLDVSGEVKFGVGAYVWGKKVDLLTVEAQARLAESCRLTFDRTVQVLGVSIDPGDEGSDHAAPGFSPPGCTSTISNRFGKAGAMKQALYNAVAVKEYYEEFGATIIMCEKFKQSFSSFTGDCNNPTDRQAVVDYWFNQYEQLLNDVLTGQAAVNSDRQQLINEIPTARLPVLEQSRNFTVFDHDFTYPVGPATVTIAIEIGGSWGARGGLEMKWVPDPTGIFAEGSINPSAQATAFAYAGVGFGPVSFGIAGELLLIKAQAPLLARIGLQQTKSPDTRPHRYFTELGLLPSPSIPPIKYGWTAQYAYGARPELHLLSGQIDLAARINLLFYKKTFRKKIADWSGQNHVWEFLSDSGEALQGNPDFGIYGEDLPFVNPASLRPLANPPGGGNINTQEVPDWILLCAPIIT